METQSWPKIWDEIFSSQSWGKYPGESLIRFIAKNYYSRVRSEIKILEIGCGTGANLWYFAKEGFRTYGIDGSKKAISIANQRLNDEKLHAELIVGDILSEWIIISKKLIDD